MRHKSIFVGFGLACVCLMPVYGQGGDTPVSTADPISNQLKLISGQLGQLRHIALANGNSQKGDNVDLKKQLSLIDKNIQLLDEQLTATHQASQQRLNALETTNHWLIAGMVILALAMLLGLRRCTQPLEANLPATMVDEPLSPGVGADLLASEPADAVVASVHQFDDEQLPDNTTTKMHIGSLVAEDVAQTHQTLIEAQKSFMKPANTQKLP